MSAHAALRRGLRRRTLLSGGAALAGGSALAGAAIDRLAAPAERPAEPVAAPFATDQEAFHGEHQAGIATPAQAHGVFVGFDLLPGTTRAKIVALLRMLSDDASRLAAGRAPLSALETTPADRPSRLTVTFGFGPGLFAAAGLEDACPPVVADFPRFATDRLEPRWGQTDLVLQICADDALAVAYARRRLARVALAFARPAWTQQGFLDARGSQAPGTTPRNLMGMLDGSANERETAQRAQVLWSRDADRPWLRGGAHLVLRRIRMSLDPWDDIDPDTKALAIGRRVVDGSPLTGTSEGDVLDRAATDAEGFPVVPPNAHASRAQARSGAERMIRRPYNYDDGFDEEGRPDAGLVFAAYQADAATAFVPVQRRLAERDALNTWITHVGSAVYAVPPGAAPGSYVGASLLEA